MNPKDIDAAISLVSTALPQALAAYSVLKLLWQARNPGKTEAEFVAFLSSASDANVTEADAILLMDGFTRGTDGGWTRPEA